MAVTKPFVAVAGNIATGKSSLVDALGEALGLDTYPERWQDNPWFGSADRLASQLWFLVAAASDTAQIATSGGVQERCFHEHALVFAAQVLSGEEAELLMDNYSLLDQLLPSPQLLVFLHASPAELERRVRRRARRQESELTLEDLSDLDRRYRDFVSRWQRCPVLPIDSEQIDLRREGTLVEVTRLIEERLK